MSQKKKIHLIAAARPNFMKVAPLYHELARHSWVQAEVIHTGQHYDYNMSESFFRDLDLPSPSHHLEVGSGSHAEQTGKVLIAYEKVCREEPPDLVVVVGDVNSTMACAIASVKLLVKTAHLEAGLRSFDRTMPEEINRIVTDSIVDMLWTPSEDGDRNLLKEGVPAERIERVGNIMIDSFEMLRAKIEARNQAKALHLTPKGYGIVTLHRPSNVDSESQLRALVDLLNFVAKQSPVVFPVHPRTKKNLERFGLWKSLAGNEALRLVEPLPYIEFMSLLLHAKYVLTDSGGIQEETTYLGIPCLTLRDNTERPITVSQGTNRLTNLEKVRNDFEAALSSNKEHTPIPLWDGKAASRVVRSIERLLA